MTNRSSIVGYGRKGRSAIVGLAVGGFFLWLAFRQTSWQQVRVTLSQADVKWLIAAMGFYAIEMVLRVVRWRGLLWEVKVLKLRSVGIALLVGYAMNFILPARLGELFRANFTGRRYKISRSGVIGSIAVERVLDGLIVVLSLVLGRLFISEQAILNSLTLVGGLLFTSIFIALWVVSKENQANWFTRLPPAIRTRIQSFNQGLAIMRGAGFGKAVNISMIIWLLDGTAIWAILNAVGVYLNWQHMLIVLGVVSLSTLLPSAPGFVGTYQYAYAFIVSLFGYQPAQGVAAATAAQIFLLGSVTLIGLVLYTYIITHSKGRLERER